MTRIMLEKAGLRYATMVAVRVKRDDSNSYERRPDLSLRRSTQLSPRLRPRSTGMSVWEGHFEAGYSDQLKPSAFGPDRVKTLASSLL